MTRFTRTASLLKATAILGFTLLLSGCGAGDTGSGSSASTASTAPSVPAAESAPVDPVAFSAASYSADQSAGSVTVTVARTGGAASAITVDYATSDDTAVAGTDYTAAQGTLQWAENDSSAKSISIPVNSSSAFSGSKSFDIVLSNPSTGARIGSPGSAVAAISGSASAGVGTLTLANSTYTVSQSNKSVTVSVNRSGGAIGTTTVGYVTNNATAIAGVDYTSMSGILSWADGDSSPKSFAVPVSSARPFSGGKYFTVALSNASAGALLGTPDNASVTINGSGSPVIGSLQLAASSYSVTQDSGTLKVTVNRTGGSSGAANVTYSTKNGTAVANTDFTGTSGTLNWADGDSASKSFSIDISNASPYSGNKTFTVALSSPSAGATVSSPGSATVTISGSASPPVGSLQLSASSYAVNQGAGKVTISVVRSGGSSGVTSVSYSTASGTAVAGTDFNAVAGTLNWTDGDTTAKTVSISVSNAHPFSGTKSFTISLASPGSGSALGSPSQAITTITGDAPLATGSLQLSSSAYSVGQAAGSLAVTVNRTGGSSGAVTVGYSTADKTALAGTDYTASSGTLHWASGDVSSKSFSIPVSNAKPYTGSKSFTVALTGPTGGATLSTPTSATTTINGSSSGVPGPSSAFWVYANGVFNWGGDYSFVAVPNYKDTSGNPLSGPYDIAVTLTSAYGGFLPFAGGTVPLWKFDDSPYNYLTFALKPTIANQTIQVFFVKIGDVPVGITINPFSGNYGPQPQLGVWGTYKIPLSDLGVQATTVYKFGIQDETGLSNNTFYLDNIGFE